MEADPMILCDGCGLAASAEHISTRLQRLEWATRYRPVHIGVLFLGAAAPASAAEYLYHAAGDAAAVAAGRFEGEAARVLDAVGIEKNEAGPAEFQRRGYFLAHVLECAVDAEELVGALERQLPLAMTRIRRSLKAKRMVVLSRAMQGVLPQLLASDLGERLLLDGGQPFELEGDDVVGAGTRLRRVLS